MRCGAGRECDRWGSDQCRQATQPPMGPGVPLRWGRFFGHRASDIRNRAMAGVVAPGQYPPPSMIRLNQWVCWTSQPFPLPTVPGMKPKWTKDDTRLIARALPFFVGMFSLASFFKGDGLIA